MKKIFLVFLVFNIQFSMFNVQFAQQSKTDSLLIVLKSAKEDTNKVFLLNALANQYISSEPQKAFDYSQQALQIAERFNWKNGIGYSFHCIGYFYYTQGDYSKTLEYWLKALNIRKELHDSSGTLRCLGNVGLAYYNQSNYPKALEYYFNALKIAEALNDKNGIASNLGNSGLVYLEQGNYDKALEYFLKALEIEEKSGDKEDIAVWLGNIGLAYNEKGEYEKSLDCYFKRLKIDEELENNYSMAINLGNIGSNYYEQAIKITNPSEENQLYGKALDYYTKALKINEELHNQSGIAIITGNIGAVLFKRKKYAESENYIKKAVAQCSSLGMLHELRDFEKLHCELDSAQGNYNSAFEHYKKFIAARDSISNDENTKNQTRLEMNYEFEKKEAATNAEHEKQIAIAEADKKKQRLFLIFIAAVAMAVATLAFVIFRSLQTAKKQKVLIEKQKLIVDEKNKHIEEKNKEITDSINYAKRIQRALLASENLLQKNLPEYFVLFKPKDIVSGDFYWARKTEDKFYLAVADCTGHGVPGAFMSLLNISLLKEAIAEKKISSPDLILNEVRNEIISALNPDGKDEGKDGMDCVLCSFEFPSGKEKPGARLSFSCANNPLWLIRKTSLADGEGLAAEFKEFKADKMPVGKFIDNSPFTLNSVTLQKGDTIYACSDGYPDQFGGAKGKKFKYAQLEKLLLSIHEKSMEEQKEILNKTIDEWRGNLEQVDDICVIGVRI